MRKSLWITPVLLLIAGIGAPTVVRASNITYTVNEVVGAGNVTGFITTDGTIGTLATGNILDWNLMVNDGSAHTFDLLGPLSGSNSQELVFGADLTANATQLLFNFSGSLSSFVFESPVFGGNGPFDCYQTASVSTCLVSPPTGTVSLGALSPETDIVFTTLTGNDVIASVATPEPGTAVLMLFGVGLVFVMRKRIAQGLPLAS